MGTWSVTPFSNDAALDWLIEIEDNNNVDFLTSSLENLSLENSDSDDLAIALCAATTVLAACFDPVGKAPKEVKDWIKYLPYNPTSNDIKLSIAAVELILNDSELSLTWESGSKKEYIKWLTTTQDLKTNLQKIDLDKIQKRKFKKKPLPRSLEKLAHYASKKNDPKAIEKIINLLEKIKDLNAPINIAPPLFFMSKYGIIEAVEYLISAKVDPFSQSLEIACEKNHLQVVDMLIDYGIPVALSYYREISTGRMVLKNELQDAETEIFHYSPALSKAVRFGSTELVKLILNRGATLDMLNNGDSLLHIACRNNNIEVLEYLIGEGVDINYLNGSGCTPISSLNFNENEIKEAYQCCVLLIKNKIEINQRDDCGQTILSNLLEKREKYDGYEFLNPIIDLLLKNGAVEKSYWNDE